MYILQNFPRGTIRPQALVAGSRHNAEKFVEKIRSFFRTSPDIVEEWNDWLLRIAPQSDDAEEYVASTGGLKLPLSDLLWIDSGCVILKRLLKLCILIFFGHTFIICNFDSDSDRILSVTSDTRCVASVKWSNRGRKRGEHDINLVPRQSYSDQAASSRPPKKDTK